MRGWLSTTDSCGTFVFGETNWSYNVSFSAPEGELGIECLNHGFKAGFGAGFFPSSPNSSRTSLIPHLMIGACIHRFPNFWK